MSITVTKIDVNPTLDASRFAMPAAAPKPGGKPANEKDEKKPSPAPAKPPRS
jgi:hypothetical protein